MNTNALTLLLAIVLLLATAPATQAAEKLSNEDKLWLEQEVAALITPEETEVFKDIDSQDRELFKVIFWARRDPDPSTAVNEFRNAFETAGEIADRQLTAPGRKGSTTGMGQVFVLLGNPDHHDQGNDPSDPGSREDALPPVAPVREETDSNPGAFSDTEFDELGESNATPIMTWTYNPNPSLGFPEGLSIRFRMMPEFGYRMIRTEEVEEALERVKTIFISNSSLTYARDEEGRLIKPGGNVDPDSPTSQVLAVLRDTKVTSADLPFETTIAYFRSDRGMVYIPMLFELSDDLTQATFFGLFTDPDGESLQQFEEEAKPARVSDGRTLYEIPTQLPPGRYKLYLGVRDNQSAAVGTQILDIDVPDYSSGKLVISSVVVYSEGRTVREPAGTPGHAFQFGSVKFRPSRTFTRKDTLGFFYFVYGLGFDAGGKPNVTGQCIFYRNGEVAGQTKEERLVTEADHAVGNAEIPLTGFEPGKYRMEVRVTDRVAGQITITDVEFVLEP
jgi:GWxTD domain-containing protein